MVKHVSEIALQLRIALVRGAFNAGKRLGVVRGDTATGQVQITQPCERLRVILLRDRLVPMRRARIRVGQRVYLGQNVGEQ